MSTGSAIMAIIALSAVLWGVGMILRERRLASRQMRDEVGPASDGAFGEADPQR